MGSLRWVVAGLGVGAVGGFVGGLVRRMRPLTAAPPEGQALWGPGGPAVPLRATAAPRTAAELEGTASPAPRGAG